MRMDRSAMDFWPRSRSLARCSPSWSCRSRSWEADVDLIRDLLDKAVIDRHGRDLGRVDSIIIEVAAGAPPRVAAIELGAAILFRRIHPILGRWMGALEQAVGAGDGAPRRVPAADILGV